MKDNFLLRKSDQEVFDELSKEQAGELIKGVFRYVNTKESGLSGVLKALFIPIQKYIDDNEKKYQKICERNRQNGANGGRPKKEETQQNPMGYFGKEKEPNKTQTDNLGQNTHISYITNHLEDNKVIRGMGEEEKEETFTNICKKIINHLNMRAGTNYKSTTETTKDKIKARLKEGYKLNDFIVVIDKKTVEWINTDMQKYLRPKTLFGTNFESYLNQPTTKKITTKDIVGKIDISDF